MLVLPTPLVLSGWGVQNIFPAVCGAGEGATSEHARHWGCVSLGHRTHPLGGATRSWLRQHLHSWGPSGQ